MNIRIEEESMPLAFLHIRDEDVHNGHSTYLEDLLMPLMQPLGCVRRLPQDTTIPSGNHPTPVKGCNIKTQDLV
jgi:hypothetical protein